MSDTSFDERDRSLGYGRRTYHAACAPGVEITDEQLYAMRRLAVALGLTPEGGKRARPEKLCALLAQHYASAPGSELAQLPRELRSLIVAMLDDRSARRLALTSVPTALDASASIESRRARYDRMRELLPPLVFWLVASGVLTGSLNGDYIYGGASSRRLHVSIKIDKNTDRTNTSPGPKLRVSYAEWRAYLNDLKSEESVDLARDLVRSRFRLDDYIVPRINMLHELEHSLLMVAVVKALLEAGEFAFVGSPLSENQALLDYRRATYGDTGSRIDYERVMQALLKESRKDRAAAIEKSTRLLAAGEATSADVRELDDVMNRWFRVDVNTFTFMVACAIERVQFRPTIDLWLAVIESVLSGPAASVLLGLAQQLDAA